MITRDLIRKKDEENDGETSNFLNEFLNFSL
jgi:hypothetical protein